MLFAGEEPPSILDWMTIRLTCTLRTASQRCRRAELHQESVREASVASVCLELEDRAGGAEVLKSVSVREDSVAGTRVGSQCQLALGGGEKSRAAKKKKEQGRNLTNGKQARVGTECQERMHAMPAVKLC